MSHSDIGRLEGLYGAEVYLLRKDHGKVQVDEGGDKGNAVVLVVGLRGQWVP